MKYIERPNYLKKIISYVGKDIIKVITGVRRSGKSFLLFNIFYNYLLKQGIKKDHIICINLENLEFLELRNSEKLYKFINSKRKGAGKYFILIDEIQYINNFEVLVNTLKNENYDVYITGSNSHLLSKDISTALRGRSIEIKVFPLSFQEYYSFVKGDIKEAYKVYSLYGGFPYVCFEPNRELKIEYLKMLEKTIATKDIIERYSIRNSNYFEAVYDMLCSSVGSYISAKKICDTLRSNGFSTITVDTIGNYLNFISESFLFEKVYRFDIKGKEYLKTLNKYYSCDIGLRNARLNFRQIDATRTLENIVYIELLRKGYEVDIGKNKNKEIDFVARKNDKLVYIQVCYSLADENTRLREISSFRGLDDGYQKLIITMGDDLFNVIDRGYVKINLFDFLLNKDSYL